MATPHPTTSPLPGVGLRSQAGAGPRTPVYGSGGLVALVSFVWLAAAVSRHHAPFAVDTSVMDGFLRVRSSAVTVAARIIGTATDPAVTAGVVIVVALWLLLRSKDLASALFLAAASVTTAVLLEVAKLVVDRPRPPTAVQLMLETNNSFPSGHVTGVVAVFGVLAFVAVGRGARRSLVATIWAALVTLVVLDRLYLGVHWASDILGAILLGATILLSAVVVAHQFLPRTRQPEPLPHTGFGQ